MSSTSVEQWKAKIAAATTADSEMPIRFNTAKMHISSTAVDYAMPRHPLIGFNVYARTRTW